jgi:hypothetical protein
MARLKYRLSVAYLCLLLAAASSVGGADSYLETVEVANVPAAAPPRFVDTKVLLSFEAPFRVRLVGARFAHEDFRVFHTYSRNEKGVFVLLLDVPRDVERLRYRLCVDGIWMSDPFNPESEVDDLGTAFSVFSLQARPEPPLESPLVAPDGSTTFVFRSQPGRRVCVVGDFNEWDPFWDRMPEIRPGLYRLTVQLTPGIHYYLFSVDGQKIPDPLNLQNARTMEGNSVSMLQVPRKGWDELSLYQTGAR